MHNDINRITRRTKKLKLNPNDKNLIDKLYAMKRKQQWCCYWCYGELTDIQFEDYGADGYWGYCTCLKCGDNLSLRHILSRVQSNENAYIDMRKQKAEDIAFNKEIAKLDAQEALEIEKERREHEEASNKQFDDYEWEKEFS